MIRVALALVCLGSCTATAPPENLRCSETASCPDGESCDARGICRAIATGVALVAPGGNHTCAVLDNGAVRCFGRGDKGQLGYGTAADFGGDEPAREVDNVGLVGSVVATDSGWNHTCVVTAVGEVHCWGDGEFGQLGNGGSAAVMAPSNDNPLVFAAPVVSVSAGAGHTCVVTEAEQAFCWGVGSYAWYGLLGAQEASMTASAMPAILGGRRVLGLAAGTLHTCAIMDDRSLRCWGENSHGQLGYGHTELLGDDEPIPDVAVDVGGAVVQVAAGGRHTCVLLASGSVRCFGDAANGSLGYGTAGNIGDDETPASAGFLAIDERVTKISCGDRHSCALTEAGNVRCWGANYDGESGYPDYSVISQPGPPVDVGGEVVDISAGAAHTCALLADGALRCWGWGGFGQLGYGNRNDIGDDEAPAVAGDVPLL